MIFRSRKLLDSCKHLPCIRCQRKGETRAAHYCGDRQHMYGKGRGIKCDDSATADFCQACDDLFSEHNYKAWPGGSKSIERSEEFQHYVILTNIRRFQMGIVVVA